MKENCRIAPALVGLARVERDWSLYLPWGLFAPWVVNMDRWAKKL